MANVSIAMGQNGLSSIQWSGQEFAYLGQKTPALVNAYLDDPTLAADWAGVNPTSSAVDPVACTVTQIFSWGVITAQYKAVANKLVVTISIQNTTQRAVSRYWMFPLAVQFPQQPAAAASGNMMMSFSMGGPGIALADFGPMGVAALVNEDVQKPLAAGFWPINNTTQWMASIFVDPTQSLNPNWPAVNRPIPPASSDSITLSLRFGPPGSTALQLASDLFGEYASIFPRIVTPPPPKPIARLAFTAKNCQYPANPRGWFTNSASIDTTTSSGIAAFQSSLLSAADTAIAEMARVSAAGAILWDIEGQQISTCSYIGDPAQAEILAPELLGVLDAFVTKFKASGFRIGFTLRPQQFTVQKGLCNLNGTMALSVDGSRFFSHWPRQQGGGFLTVGSASYAIGAVNSTESITLAAPYPVPTPSATYLYGVQSNTGDPFGVLYEKVAYCVERWGATLFYVDSALDWTGNITPPSVWQRLIAAFPGVTFFPEWKLPGTYAYAYAWLDGMNGEMAPSQFALNVYPNAAGLIRVPSDSQMAQPATVATLTAAVQNGSILLFDGWYPHSGNTVVANIYRAIYG